MPQRNSPQSIEPAERKAKLKPTPPAFIDPLQRYSIPETNAFLRQSNARTYKQIKIGELRVIKDGDRTYVPGSEIVRRSTLPAT